MERGGVAGMVDDFRRMLIEAQYGMTDATGVVVMCPAGDVGVPAHVAYGDESAARLAAEHLASQGLAGYVPQSCPAAAGQHPHCHLVPGVPEQWSGAVVEQRRRPITWPGG